MSTEISFRVIQRTEDGNIEYSSAVVISVVLCAEYAITYSRVRRLMSGEEVPLRCIRSAGHAVPTYRMLCSMRLGRSIFHTVCGVSKEQPGPGDVVGTFAFRSCSNVSPRPIAEPAKQAIKLAKTKTWAGLVSDRMDQILTTMMPTNIVRNGSRYIGKLTLYNSDSNVVHDKRGRYCSRTTEYLVSINFGVVGARIVLTTSKCD